MSLVAGLFYVCAETMTSEVCTGVSYAGWPHELQKIRKKMDKSQIQKYSNWCSIKSS